MLDSSGVKNEQKLKALQWELWHECLFIFSKTTNVCGKPSSLDRCTFPPRPKLDGWGLIHLRASQELRAAEGARALVFSTRTALDLCGTLALLNHVMHCVSRHLDPLQADPYNGSNTSLRA